MAESQNSVSNSNLMDNYQLLEVINRGSYGSVYRARDKRNNKNVEIRILETLPRHPMVTAASGRQHMEYDLHSLRDYWRNPFNLNEIKYILEGILKGVSHLHDYGIMHRDIKPSNILFTASGQIKICDSGLLAPYRTAEPFSYSPQVDSPWYRAPELLRGSQRYSWGVDMWAVGCVMAELVVDQELFRGESEASMLDCINEIINPPFDKLRFGMEVTSTYHGTAALTASGLDLLQRLLAYEPEDRIAARDALNHPWFRE